ncbi:ArsR/SmtB family transcription factor [Amycolatopsis halotolerans]|uniref:ArsR/SmtB family transcription factor n=1 Tax=Amycolatopsis halotolerans TaxID=330083 RepID=A0ABV7QEC8_9PSEU
MPEVRSIAAGEIAGLKMLEEAAAWYQRAALAPHWATMSQMIGDDRNARAQQLAAGGVEELLALLPGTQRWTSPVLHLDYPTDKDLHLRGRGITLVPSYFCVGRPVTLVDPELPPVLTYPLEVTTVRPRRDALSDLLGGTRAHILRMVQVPRSTTALADKVGASPGSVSKHTKVLRQAGLITSSRRGATMLHLTTGLGRRLLAAETSGTPC